MMMMSSAFADGRRDARSGTASARSVRHRLVDDRFDVAACEADVGEHSIVERVQRTPNVAAGQPDTGPHVQPRDGTKRPRGGAADCLAENEPAPAAGQQQGIGEKRRRRRLDMHVHGRHAKIVARNAMPTRPDTMVPPSAAPITARIAADAFERRLVIIAELLLNRVRFRSASMPAPRSRRVNRQVDDADACVEMRSLIFERAVSGRVECNWRYLSLAIGF
jgi:hypothetical protein